MRIHDSGQDDSAVTHRKKQEILFATILALTAVLLASQGSSESSAGTLSLGGPNDGTLRDGARLPARGKGFISNPGRTNREADFGTDELVASLRQIGSDVERWAPGAVLVVNDLSLPEGGEIPHHQSHEAGRDVDVLFYSTDAKGAALRTRAARFDEEGVATTGAVGAGRVLFDRRRNWYLVKSLVLNDNANLQRIFVAERLRKLMLDHARSAGEPEWLIERAGQAMCEPTVPHDDHFHYRLFCTAEDYRQGCRDSWPIYPWRRTEMARLGIGNVLTAPPPERRRRRRSRNRRIPSFGRTWCPSPR
jgi:penicillin-insensitive murein DD-endopeptidase